MRSSGHERKWWRWLMHHGLLFLLYGRLRLLHGRLLLFLRGRLLLLHGRLQLEIHTWQRLLVSLSL